MGGAVCTVGVLVFGAGVGVGVGVGVGAGAGAAGRAGWGLEARGRGPRMCSSCWGSAQPVLHHFVTQRVAAGNAAWAVGEDQVAEMLCAVNGDCGRRVIADLRRKGR